MATSLPDNTASRCGRSRQGSGAPSWSVCWSCCSSRSLDRSVARPPVCPDWSARWRGSRRRTVARSEEHTSELQSRRDLVCRLLLEKQKDIDHQYAQRIGHGWLTDNGHQEHYI